MLNPYINFVVDTCNMLNLTALLNTAIPKDSTKKKNGKFELLIKNVKLVNARFNYGKTNHPEVDYGVNFKDMRLFNLNLDARNLLVVGGNVSMNINRLSFREQSGLCIDNLRSEFSISSKNMKFNKLRILSDSTELAFQQLHFKYNGYNKLDKFTQNVTIYAIFSDTKLNSSFLAYFAPTLKGYNIPITINGNVNGKVNDLHIRELEIGYGNKTFISSNINLTGLPNINQTLIVADFKELTSHSIDLKKLTLADGVTPLLNLPTVIDSIGKITYRGKFAGYINDFITYGMISTDIGNISIDASFTPQELDGYKYNGQLNVHNVDLSKIAGTNMLGKISLNAHANGKIDKNNSITATSTIDIKSVEANQYNYSDIKVEGTLSNRTYIGTINLNDPNCKLNFLGKLDFSDSIPVYDFSAFVPKIDLVALNFNKTDSISIASFLLTTKFSGNTLDNSKGEIKLLNSTYRNQRGDFKLSDITIAADNLTDSKVVSLKSEFAEGELRSKYNYSNAFSYLTKFFSKYIPSLTHDSQNVQIANTNEQVSFNDYLIKLRVKKSKKITDVLHPNIQIAENTSIFGILNPDMQTLSMKMMVPEVKYGNSTIKNLSIDGQTKDSSFCANIIAPVITMGNVIIKNFDIGLEASNNSIDFKLNWDNKNTPSNNGTVNAEINLKNFNKNGHIADININQTSFVINDSLWSIMPSSISIDSSLITFNKFLINSQTQSLVVNGAISHNPTDTLLLKLNNLNIATFNLYLGNFGYYVNGNITGEAKINSLYDNPNLFADINIPSMLLNNNLIGNIHFKSQWIDKQKRMFMRLLNLQNGTNTFQAQGFIYPQSSLIDFDVNLNQIKLKHLEPMLKNNVSGITGNLTGQLKIDGSIEKPAINGELNIEHSQLTVEFLKTKYSINSPITLSNSDILFKNFKLFDINSNEATLNGSITTKFFKEINMGLNLSTKNFQCMNTTEYDNQSFYASVYGSGMVMINGTPKKLGIDIYMKTESKTAIHLPLGSRSTVEENNFLTFVSSNPDDIIIDDEFDLELDRIKKGTEMNLNMEIQVTPEAEAQIIIDKKMGDIIRANGNGNLKIEMNPSKDIFKMLGNFEIEKGDYLFTLKNLLNKKLKIENGSSITWNGDPLDANTNITATYRVKTSLKPILGEEYTARIPVDCQIHLTQKLMSPNIEFDITLPNGNSDEKTALATALNTQEKINTQFLGLLGINSFISDASVNSASTENANLGTMGLYNTVSELLSNQLSNLLSSDKLDFGINYRPGIEEELTTDQVELALSTQIFDDRLTLNGSAFNNNNNGVSAPIAGNFNAEFKLNKSGKLRAKAFARYNDDFLNTISSSEDEYTTGVGFMYREEFNNFRDLRYKMRHIFSNETQNQFNFDDETIEPDSTSVTN